jgi:phospholipid/cholesterol/gamma-HCH transport system substrate-binding protein
MKKEIIHKIKLGIFVSIGIALFVTGIYFIGETRKLFSSTFRISAMFKDVNGLQVGNNVRFAGINVGTIEGIEIITDSSVKVDMILDVKTQQFIKKDAKAIIGSDGLMGNKIMNVSPGTTGNPPIENNDMIGTTKPISFDEMLLKLKTTGDNAALITNDLAAMTGNIRSGRGTIGKLFMDTVFADNLDRTIVNVKQGTKGFKQNMDAAKHSFLLGGFFKKDPKEIAAKKLKKENKIKEEKKIKEAKQKYKDDEKELKNKKKDEKKKLKEDAKKLKDEQK